MIARGEGVCVANQGVELRGARVVTTLGVVAPTIGADHRARAHGVACERFVGWGRFIISGSVEDALTDDAGAWRDAEEIAGISDNLLVPESVDEQFRKLKEGE